jgi:high affinity Mn2+ porin
MRPIWLCLLLCAIFTTFKVLAEVAEPEPRADDQFDLMNWLTEQGLHNIKEETWNAYGQFTYISSWKSAFPALYTNLNGSNHSLLPTAERSYTGTATLFLGVKPWQGAGVYVVPELIAAEPLTGLLGLGGVIQNFELQKNGSKDPRVYLSRAYIQQTFGFGGNRVQLESNPMQLGGKVDSRRLVITAGNFSILDFFDKNSFSGDLRRQFNNMAFLTYAAYDFAADARGYTIGLVAEYYHDDWAFRFGHTLPPADPNQLPLVFKPFTYYGDQVELEHKHNLYGQPGAVRVLGYRNRENMGLWTDAINAYQLNNNFNATNCIGFNYGSNNSTAPDLCWARKPNVKMGIGINFEQQATADIGLFFRGMYSDGKTEVYSYTSTDRSISFGALMKGIRWGRERDLVGLGYAVGWLSAEHVNYLNRGGIDGFIGDGRITYRPEMAIDLFYSYNAWSSLWFTADYQHIENPAYNADRGPVDVYAVKGHFEF